MRNINIIIFAILSLSGCVTEPTFTDSEVYSDSPSSELWKEALVIDILSKAPELNSHRMNGEIDNQVYYRDDGTEIVVNANEEIVNTPENKGSYNYYHPEKRPIAHYMADIKPWIVYGNDRDDPTTKAQRLDAYSQDLAIGLFLSFNERTVTINLSSFQFDSPEEFRETKLWVDTFESQSIFELYLDSNMITYEQALEITNSIINDLP